MLRAKGDGAMPRAGKCLLVLSAISIAGAAFAGEPAAISKIEARSLSAPQVKRRVMEQLAAILTEERSSGHKPPVTMLTDMAFDTQPIATAVPGLCQIDRLTVAFRSAEPDRGDARTPVFARGLTAERYFHFAAAPKKNHTEMADYDRSPDDAVCRNTKLWRDEFFTAPDEEGATDGYLLAHRAIDAIDAIVARDPSFVLVCNTYPTEKERACADIARELRSAPISSIARCKAGEAEVASDICYDVDIGDRSLRIIATPYAYGANAPPPLTIRRVELNSLIIIADSRVD